MKIAVLGSEISGEGLKLLLSERGFVVAAWPLTQLSRCLSGLIDATNQIVIVEAATNEASVAICRSIRGSFTKICLLMICDDHTDDVPIQLASMGIFHTIARSASVDALCEHLDHCANEVTSDLGVDADAPGIGLGRGGRIENGRQLSAEEIETLLYLGNGESNKTIAVHLNLDEATVKVHVKTLLRKLSLANRTQAAIWAVQHGFVWQQDA